MLFWFDDGQVEDLTKTAPFLKELGHTGIFAIVTEWVGKPGYMTIEQIKELIRQGHMIASHGTDHKLMLDMNEAEIKGVLGISKAWICENLDVEPFAFVAPWNMLRRWQLDLALEVYGQVRAPLFLHFHSRNATDVCTTIPKYIKGPCPARGKIRRDRYDKSLRSVRARFGCNFEGVK